MTVCYLGLGSNLKTPERILRLAILRLKKMPKSAVLDVAPLYNTPPWGVHAQPHFCNTAVKIQTTLSPLQLLNACQALEKQFGRVRKKRWGPRTLDIDILFYGNTIMNTPKLTLPHPYIFQRRFVLEPLQNVGWASAQQIQIQNKNSKKFRS
jgi:2-amino-4-hydroxy-6-hydroxymethyldihydropteridine diphosphokinase